MNQIKMGLTTILSSIPILIVLISSNQKYCHGSNNKFHHKSLPYVLINRGGSSPPPPPPPNYYSNDEQHQQQQQGHSRRIDDGNYPPPDNYYNEQDVSDSREDYHRGQQQPFARAYQKEHQQQQGQQQQQQDAPPPLPTWDDTHSNQMNNQNYMPQQTSQINAQQQMRAPPSMSGAPAPPAPAQSSSDGNIESSISEIVDKDLIFSGLKRLYRKKILPLELSSKYGLFQSPPMSPSDFEAKPMVLLLGQYSVGKTTFIEYLLGRSFPGQRIGPEPTTDRFTAIMIGARDKITPGAALCSQADRPFRGLSPFGNNFLSRLEGVEMDAPILHNITLIDTPGILSGQKQGEAGRNYDYESVMKWFAERADLIIIMFDAHKLDISDELKRVMELMIPHSEKVRVVLNKADCVNTQQLMRVCKFFFDGLFFNKKSHEKVY